MAILSHWSGYKYIGGTESNDFVLGTVAFPTF